MTNTRDEQVRKVLAAIEAAHRSVAEAEPEPVSEPTFERDDAPPAEAGVPYVEAEFEVPRGVGLTDLRVDTLAEFAKRVIEMEGPVHREEVARRLCTLWGYARLGSRIEEAVDRSVTHLVRSKAVVDGDGFLTMAGVTTVPVRNRSGTKSGGLRKPDYLPPAEVAAAIRQAVARNIGSTPDEVVVAVARDLGFATTAARLKDIIAAALRVQLTAGAVSVRDDRLFATSKS